jgi:pimeloyl-[acyl-carrier protein] methyl ester esterase
MVSSQPLPIVLLPGLDGMGELLRSMSAQLAARRPVDLIDYPLDRWLSYAELVAYVVGRVPDRQFVILGESYSGPIAIAIAKTDPRVAGLVLASSFARHPLPAQLAHLVWALDLKWAPKPLIASALMGRWSAPETETQLYRVLAKLPREIVQGRVRDALRVDKLDQLRRTRCPLLCLHGRQDRLVGKRSVHEIIDARPDGKLQWLDAPHMLLTTHAEAAAGIIDAFCSRLENQQG